MQIMTANGWRDLVPKNITPPQHVKSLCEENGIDVDFPAELLFCNASAAYVSGTLKSYDDLQALKTIKGWKAWDAYKAKYGWLLKEQATERLAA